MKDLKVLEETGVIVKFQNSEFCFKGTISMIVSDNLAAHALGGFMCNFSTVDRFCRFCTFSKKKSSTKTRTSELTMRTKEGYENNLAAIEIDPSLKSIYGLKSNSSLNQLAYFHVVNGLPPDIAHDCFEGFAVDLVTSVIIYCVKQHFFTLQEFNTMIEKFPFSQCDKQNKPQIVKIKPLTQYKVKQTACEMWNLLRLLPFMIGQSIPIGDRIWVTYTEFLDIIERICAPSFLSEDLTYLQYIIDEFFGNYLETFEVENLKPKAHFLKHYPLMISLFGPLVKTLRFEAKNGYFKSIVQQTKNRINICKTMARRHQILMLLHYQEEQLLESKSPKGISCEEVPIEVFRLEIQSLLFNKFESADNELFVTAKSVIYNGQRYSTNEVTILGFAGDEYIFGLIERVLFHSNKVYIVTNLLHILKFDTHYHAYEVHPSDAYDLRCIDELYDYHPLGLYYVNNRKLVPLKHYVQEEE